MTKSLISFTVGACALLSSQTTEVSAQYLYSNTDDWCRYRADAYGYSTKQQKSKSECNALYQCAWDTSLPGGGGCQKKRVAIFYAYGSNDWCKFKGNTKQMKSKSECSSEWKCAWDSSLSGGGACQTKPAYYSSGTSYNNGYNNGYSTSSYSYSTNYYGGNTNTYVPSYTYGSNEWCKFKTGTNQMKSKSECASVYGDMCM